MVIGVTSDRLGHPEEGTTAAEHHHEPGTRRRGGTARAEADPSPVLLAALSAAADAAAVRWKQHKELSTWRLVKEEKKLKKEKRGWARGCIQGTVAAGSRRGCFHVKLSLCGATYATVPTQFGCGTRSWLHLRVCVFGREAKDRGGEVTAGGDADRRKI